MSEQDIKKFFASAVQLDVEDIPRVIAQGSGSQAKQIAAKAREHNVPVLQDVALSKQLAAISLGDEIPKVLYIAIAELLTYLSTIEAKAEKIVSPLSNEHGKH